MTRIIVQLFKVDLRDTSIGETMLYFRAQNTSGVFETVCICMAHPTMMHSMLLPLFIDPFAVQYAFFSPSYLVVMSFPCLISDSSELMWTGVPNMYCFP